MSVAAGRRPAAIRAALVTLLLAVTLLAPAGCGDGEPEERRAFIAFLTANVLGKKNAGVPEPTRAQEKSLGGYADHYALVTGFQQDMRDLAGRAERLLQETLQADLAALAAKPALLAEAAREARTLSEKTLELLEKADKAKSRLVCPPDLAPVYDAAYDKSVSRPGRLFAAVTLAAHEAFAANAALLDFTRAHSRDVTFENGQYVLYNAAIEPEFRALEAAEREKAGELEKAFAAFAKAMTE